MSTEAGEYIVGAYLQERFNCAVILYNVRAPGGGLKGLPELDVVGLDLRKRRAFLCEVTTHLHGMNRSVAARMEKKYAHQRLYAETVLQGFTPCYMLWSPRVDAPELKSLRAHTGLTLVVNRSFKRAVNRLQKIAKDSRRTTGNPFMRALQILEHLRDR
jgi:hypothetical protein